jgi:hypothetical protein
MNEPFEVGFQAFVSDGGEQAFGAIRAISPSRHEITVYVENAGDFVVPIAAITASHSQKVILDCAKLPAAMRKAIGHAHDAED